MSKIRAGVAGSALCHACQRGRGEACRGTPHHTVKQPAAGGEAEGTAHADPLQMKICSSVAWAAPPALARTPTHLIHAPCLIQCESRPLRRLSVHRILVEAPGVQEGACMGREVGAGVQGDCKLRGVQDGARGRHRCATGAAPQLMRPARGLGAGRPDDVFRPAAQAAAHSRRRSGVVPTRSRCRWYGAGGAAGRCCTLAVASGILGLRRTTCRNPAEDLAGAATPCPKGSRCLFNSVAWHSPTAAAAASAP